MTTNRLGHPEVTKRASASITSLDADARAFDVVASTSAEDLHGEVLEQDWKLDRFLKSPVVFFGHESWDLPIGKAENVRVEDGELRARIVLLSAKANPRAEQVLQAMNEGALRAVSVGYRPGKRTSEKRGGREVVVHSENELLEISIVGIGANPEALAKSEDVSRRGDGAIKEGHMDKIRKALGLATETSEDEVTKHLEKRLDAHKLELDVVKAKAARADELEKELATLRAKQTEAEIEALVKSANDRLPPAKRDEFAANVRKHGLDWGKAMVDLLPPVVGQPGPKPAKTDGDGTPAAKSHGAVVAKLAGLTEDDFKAAKAAGVI
jgi:HK97 family phage prohead protease